ncbi:HlyD family efflux transporter periplasmic adaptor subunit [Argonema galeatum]|uniref:HlyD family efflux transporter periplasmic adaptor subunit n=1 Tax=Argonema galeatum TaxID=2942762 RepID=UPI002013966E|nr:HlyD family efflux transporter periplasmic adaptor subunit [Argonema galeatum]MCL1466093.1 HlyD family efflux transporter periplasmic adaptor subunit [Argonema galeatum A003/A1]
MSAINSNNSPKRIQLKVVPPKDLPETTPVPKTTPTSPVSADTPNHQPSTANQKTQPVKSGESFNLGRLILIGGLLAGGLWVSQMPIPTSVRTEAKLEPLSDSHRFVYMQVPGSITKFWVNSGDFVNAGQRVASVATLDLDAEIIQKQAKLQEQESSSSAALARIPVVQSKLEETLQIEMAARRQVEETRQEIEGMKSGNPPPEIQKFQAEIEALSSNITGIEAEIVGLKENLRGTEKLIAEYEQPKFKELMARIPLQEKLEQLRSQKATLIGNIGRKEQEILEIKHQMSAKAEEIAAVKLERQQKLANCQDELASRVAIKQTAMQELAAAKDEVAIRTPVIQTLKKELQKLQSEQLKNQILEAPISGIVVSQNLHEKVGKKMPENQDVLEIANLDKLVALIEVAQTDSDLVKGIFEKPSATVILQPLEPGLSAITTRIEKIEPVLQSDPSGQKQLLRVRAIVDNRQKLFQPNAKVYAQIEVEPIPLYQRVQRELMKLLKIRKYV